MNEIYIVKEGDTLGTIANLYGVSIADIVKWNNLGNKFYIEPGMNILIPLHNTEPFNVYIVKDGDTLYKIAKEYNADIDTLAAINGLKIDEYIYIDQKLLIPKVDIKTYLTKMGDTIESVTHYMKTTTAELIVDNANIYLLPEQLIVVRKRNI
ncbi:MAG: LysM peptidoglycan-binding domain-containing protein [Bacilli bacterium]